MVSIVIPFYKKFFEFEVALKYNARYFAGDREVVLVLDSFEEEKAILELINKYKEIKWKILINRKSHPWRNPAPVINSGIRNSSGECVMVMSPESVMKYDIIDLLVDKVKDYNCFCCGYVVFCKLEKDLNWRAIRDKMPYGSIFAKKEDFFKIKGYSEDFSGFGAEDDEIRRRLQLSGLKPIYVNDAVLYHLERENRPNKICNPENLKKLNSAKLITNGDNWGKEVTEIIYNYEAN